MATTDLEIKIKNIGAAVGERTLATISSPGLWEVTGPNAGGKSTICRVLTMLSEERLLTSEARHVSHGEVEGWLHFGPAKIVFSVGEDGSPLPPTRTGHHQLPSLEEIPHPIELLITGGSSRQRTVKDPATRARNRLSQLMAFAPIPATGETLDRLCNSLEERSFLEGFSDDQLTSWSYLMGLVETKVARFKPPQLLGPEAIRAEVISKRPQGSSGILDDHHALVKILNALANAAKHGADQQELIISQMEGRVQEALEAAARTLGKSSTRSFRSELETWDVDSTSISESLEIARQAAATVRVQFRQRIKEQESRDLLASSHGDRPELLEEKSKVSAAITLLNSNQASRDQVHSAFLEAKERAENSRQKHLKEVGTLKESWVAWKQASEILTNDFTGDPPESPIQSHCQAIIQLTGSLNIAHSAYLSTASEAESDRLALHNASQELELKEQALNHAQESLSQAEASLEKGLSHQASWDSTSALIAQQVPGPGQDEVSEADSAVEKIEAQAKMSSASASFLKLLAEKQAERRILEWLLDLHADYRESAVDSWVHLGAVVTESLALPWLKLDGMDLKLIYDAQTKMLATEETAREEVRLLDDQAMVSTAELHEAMLTLLLDRRKIEDPEGSTQYPMLVLPWDFERPSAIAALDDDRKARFAAAVEKAGLVVLAERPRRDGEPEGVQMLRVQSHE